MSTPYSIRNAIARSGAAKRQFVLDPGPGGTVKVHPADLNVLRIDTAGARTLQAAAQVPVGLQVLVVVTASGVTVNGTSIADGQFAVFIVTLTTGAVNQWTVSDSSDMILDLFRGITQVTQTALTDSVTVNAAQLLTRVLDGTPTAAAAYQMPTAAGLVAAMLTAVPGDSFDFVINNKSAGANTITVTTNTGITLDGTLTVAQNVVRRFMVIVTNVTAGAEAYFVYGLGD